MKLRVGLIGLGSTWDSRYLPALRALRERFDVRAVCEEVACRAETAARHFDASSVDGFQTLVARPDVDAVLMLARQWYGSLPILAACDAGKAIYCASALFMDLPDAGQIRDRVDRSGVAFMTAFARRQAPATLRLKELIATHLGRPHTIFCHHSPRSKENVNGSRTPSRETLDLVELVDWCSYVADAQPNSVLGIAHGNSECGQFEQLTLEYTGCQGSAPPVLAQINRSQHARRWPEATDFRPPAEMRVVCERGVAYIDLPATLIWFDQAGRHMESLDRERPVGEQLLLQFHRSVTSLVRNPSSLEDTFQSLGVVLAGRRSQSEGCRVTV